MSTPAVLVWDQAYNRNGDPDLPRAVVNAIRTYVNNHTLEGWVKQETLADCTGLSIRQVRRQIRANVAAGWLEATPGNSSGRASSFRLTFPKADMDVRIGQGSAPTKADTDDRLPREKADIYDREGGHGCPEKADMGVRPTTPITTPRNFSRSSEEERTSQEKADMGVRIPDPFGGSDIYLPANTTSEFKEDMDVRLGKEDTDVPLSKDEIAEMILAEHHGEAKPKVPTPRTPKPWEEMPSFGPPIEPRPGPQDYPGPRWWF